MFRDAPWSLKFHTVEIKSAKNQEVPTEVRIEYESWQKKAVVKLIKDWGLRLELT